MIRCWALIKIILIGNQLTNLKAAPFTKIYNLVYMLLLEQNIARKIILNKKLEIEPKASNNIKYKINII